MDERPGALETADHSEVVLMSVQIRGEHHPSLVEARGRAEEMARQRQGGGKDRLVAREVAGVEGMERGRRGRRDDVEDAEKRVAVAALVAADGRRVVEVIPAVHVNALGEALPQGDLPLLV